jgi:hypothetical protein
LVAVKWSVNRGRNSVFETASPSPSEFIERLNEKINGGLSDPKLKARFVELGATVLPDSPADFGTLIAEEIEK